MPLFGPGQLEALQANADLYLRFVESLRQEVAALPGLRVLDYGAGAIPGPLSFFSDLHPNETLIAYDPNISQMVVPETDRLIWTNIEPDGPFDLIVCSFSGHHMEKSPRRVIQGLLEKYPGSLIAIADYDFVGSSLADFQAVFIADAEQTELQDLYGGDVESCFEEHSRWGYDDWMHALEASGYEVKHMMVGKGYKGHKFFLIAGPRR